MERIYGNFAFSEKGEKLARQSLLLPSCENIGGRRGGGVDMGELKKRQEGGGSIAHS